MMAIPLLAIASKLLQMCQWKRDLCLLRATLCAAAESPRAEVGSAVVPRQQGWLRKLPLSVPLTVSPLLKEWGVATLFFLKNCDREANITCETYLVTSNGFFTWLTVVRGSIKHGLRRNPYQVGITIWIDRRGKGLNVWMYKQSEQHDRVHTVLVPLGTNWSYWNLLTFFTKWILWKCSWNTFSTTHLIKIFIVVLPHILANFSQLHERHLSNYVSYLWQKSRFTGISFHTPLLFTKTQTITIMSKTGNQQSCLYKVVISLLVFQCFKTCLVYKAKTSLAPFFRITTSKSSEVSALLLRLIHNQVAQDRTSF